MAEANVELRIGERGRTTEDGGRTTEDRGLMPGSLQVAGGVPTAPRGLQPEFGGKERVRHDKKK